MATCAELQAEYLDIHTTPERKAKIEALWESQECEGDLDPGDPGGGGDIGSGPHDPNPPPPPHG